MVDFAATQAKTHPNAGFVDVFQTIAQGDMVVKHYTYSNEPSSGAELTIADFFGLRMARLLNTGT